VKPRRLLDSVGLPPQSEVETKLFRHLKSSTRAVEPKLMYARLAEDFKLTAEQRHAGRSNDPDWHWLVRQARRRLVDAGLVNKSQHGLWSLTETGRNTREWPIDTSLADLGLE
jgi:hypothetical protein